MELPPVQYSELGVLSDGAEECCSAPLTELSKLIYTALDMSIVKVLSCLQQQRFMVSLASFLFVVTFESQQVRVSGPTKSKKLVRAE
jgi:hypothetical protein